MQIVHGHSPKYLCVSGFGHTKNIVPTSGPAIQGPLPSSSSSLTVLFSHTRVCSSRNPCPLLMAHAFDHFLLGKCWRTAVRCPALGSRWGMRVVRTTGQMSSFYGAPSKWGRQWKLIWSPQDKQRWLWEHRAGAHNLTLMLESGHDLNWNPKDE